MMDASFHRDSRLVEWRLFYRVLGPLFPPNCHAGWPEFACLPAQNLRGFIRTGQPDPTSRGLVLPAAGRSTHVYFFRRTTRMVFHHRTVKFYY